MRWLLWSSGSQKNADDASKSDSSQDDKRNVTGDNDNDSAPTPSSTATTLPRHRDWNSILNATDWAHFTEPRNLIPTVLLTSGILFAIHLHRRFLRRIPEAPNISHSYFRRRSLLGRVTSVGDGDNFRLYHTPGGRLAGWGWLPWKKVPTSKKELKDRTVCLLHDQKHCVGASALGKRMPPP
jgi:hypothetical protein